MASSSHVYKCIFGLTLGTLIAVATMGQADGLASSGLNDPTPAAPGANLAYPGQVMMPAISQYDWSGGYIGGMLGASNFNAQPSDLTDVITNDAPDVAALVAAYGLVGGYSWALRDSNAIIGVELDASFGYQSDKSVPTNASSTEFLNFNNSWDSLIALKFRAGIAQGRSLVYFSAGPAFAQANYEMTATASGNTATVGENVIGVNIGGGIDHAFRENLVGRFEVDYTSMPTTETVLTTSTGNVACGNPAQCRAYFTSSATTFRVGLLYKF